MLDVRQDGDEDRRGLSPEMLGSPIIVVGGEIGGSQYDLAEVVDALGCGQPPRAPFCTAGSSKANKTANNSDDDQQLDDRGTATTRHDWLPSVWQVVR